MISNRERAKKKRNNDKLLQQRNIMYDIMMSVHSDTVYDIQHKELCKKIQYKILNIR